MGGESATLEEIMKKADIVIATTGVRGLIKPETVRKGQIIMALSNPDPEIEPALAIQHGAAFAADGKGINNVLGFPGLFKGALAARAPRFTDAMLLAAARTIAELAKGEELVPDPLDLELHKAVTAGRCGRRLTGVSRLIALRSFSIAADLDLADTLGGHAEFVREILQRLLVLVRRASAP